MTRINAKLYADIIINKVIDKSLSDEHNMEKLEEYLKHALYRMQSDAIGDMRRASVQKEAEILNALDIEMREGK